MLCEVSLIKKTTFKYISILKGSILALNILTLKRTTGKDEQFPGFLKAFKYFFYFLNNRFLFFRIVLIKNPSLVSRKTITIKRLTPF